MVDLNIKGLDDNTLRRLRKRAEQHGVTLEEEARTILRNAVATPDRIGDYALKLFGREHGVDLEIPRHEPHEPTGSI